AGGGGPDTTPAAHLPVLPAERPRPGRGLRHQPRLLERVAGGARRHQYPGGLRPRAELLLRHAHRHSALITAGASGRIQGEPGRRGVGEVIVDGNHTPAPGGEDRRCYDGAIAGSAMNPPLARWDLAVSARRLIGLARLLIAPAWLLIAPAWLLIGTGRRLIGPPWLLIGTGQLLIGSARLLGRPIRW